jgi:hypothetical protein
MKYEESRQTVIHKTDASAAAAPLSTPSPALVWRRERRIVPGPSVRRMSPAQPPRDSDCHQHT